jgi:enoyl-CoA hydratase/carnithine racemase
MVGLLMRGRTGEPPIFGTLKGKGYWIYINRPDKLNAMSYEAWKILEKEIRNGCESNAIAIVIIGKGRAFSSGDDIGDLYSLKDLRSANEFFETIWSAFKQILECEKPVIAAVNGLALGGGAEILLVSDIVIAARTAWISFPEVSLGLLPPFLLSLGPYLLGLRRVKFLALTAQRLSAEEAKEYGLVDLVVDDGRLIREIEALIEDLESYPPEALKSIKKLSSLPLKNINLNVKKSIEEVSKLTQHIEAKRKMEAFLYRRRT